MYITAIAGHRPWNRAGQSAGTPRAKATVPHQPNLPTQHILFAGQPRKKPDPPPEERAIRNILAIIQEQHASSFVETGKYYKNPQAAYTLYKKAFDIAEDWRKRSPGQAKYRHEDLLWRLIAMSQTLHQPEDEIHFRRRLIATSDRRLPKAAYIIHLGESYLRQARHERHKAGGHNSKPVRIAIRRAERYLETGARLIEQQYTQRHALEARKTELEHRSKEEYDAANEAYERWRREIQPGVPADTTSDTYKSYRTLCGAREKTSKELAKLRQEEGKTQYMGSWDDWAVAREKLAGIKLTRRDYNGAASELENVLQKVREKKTAELDLYYEDPIEGAHKWLVRTAQLQLRLTDIEMKKHMKANHGTFDPEKPGAYSAMAEAYETLETARRLVDMDVNHEGPGIQAGEGEEAVFVSLFMLDRQAVADILTGLQKLYVRQRRYDQADAVEEQFNRLFPKQG